MLYCYPVAATADNWFHNCLCEILRTIHADLKAGETPPEWPDIIPGEYRERLRSRTGLRDRLMKYVVALNNLTSIEQDRVLCALENENRIPELLTCRCDCDSLYDLPKLIREPAKDLFKFSYELLTELGIRDTHFNAIYHAAPYPICPFCGCEYFDAPGAPRHDLDHYIAKEYYPFAAANLRNLVPMGDRCNSSYKHRQDMLKRGDGTRRRAFDPYGIETVEISLDNSEPFAGADGRLPRWEIEFNRDNEEAGTWDEVFHIRERYKRDVLDRSFNNWLRGFTSWCRSLRKYLRRIKKSLMH